MMCYHETVEYSYIWEATMEKFLKRFMIAVLSVSVLAACGNGNGNSDNLIDTGNVTEGSWVGYNGDDVEDEEMVTSELIPYNPDADYRSEEHTSELQSRGHLVCRLLLEK